jgi:hypothetical protein
MALELFLTLKPNPNPNHKNPLLFWRAKFRTVAKLQNCFICLKCNDFLENSSQNVEKKSKMSQDFQTWFKVCIKKCIRIFLIFFPLSYFVNSKNLPQSAFA